MLAGRLEVMAWAAAAPAIQALIVAYYGEALVPRILDRTVGAKSGDLPTP